MEKAYAKQNMASSKTKFCKESTKVKMKTINNEFDKTPNCDGLLFGFIKRGERKQQCQVI